MDISFLKNNSYYGNTLLQWLTSLAIIGGAFLVAKLFYIITSKVIKKITSKTKTNLDDILVDMLEEPFVLFIVLVGIFWGIDRLILPKNVDEVMKHIYRFLFTINLTWLVVRVVDSLIREYIRPLASKTESDIDDHLLPILQKGSKIIIWVIGIVAALNNAGYNVGALLAGLGIGGLALAMAAKDMVSNFFGGVTVLTDKPFKIGDRIKISGYEGNITEIGLRSTRLKTLENRIVTIPNMKFTDQLVENVSQEPSRKVVLNLGLTYDTTPEKMNGAIEILKKLATSEKRLEPDTTIAFNNFTDSTLNLMFIYFIKAGEDVMSVQNTMNLNILKEFNKAKLSFAYPTRTVITKK